MERIKIASVHGRFQPFHNGHLDYVLQAFDRADFILVGLTQIFRPRLDQNKTESRDDASANPLSFFERSELVEAALIYAGINRNRFRITPFPIERPETLHEFIPTGSVCFTTRVTEWNDEKVIRLKNYGFRPEILKTSEQDNVRVVSGTKIRRLLCSGNPKWKKFVPEAVSEMISSRFEDRFSDI